MSEKRARPAGCNPSGLGSSVPAPKQKTTVIMPGRCVHCVNPDCDALAVGGSSTAAGNVSYSLTPLQAVQAKLGEMLELATRTLDEREHEAFVSILLTRAAAEGARMAWRKERASGDDR